MTGLGPRGRGLRPLVFVDNGSSDGTPESLETLAPWAATPPTIRTSATRGYQHGPASRRACRGVLILNPDAAPLPGCAARLLQALPARRRYRRAEGQRCGGRTEVLLAPRTDPPEGPRRGAPRWAQVLDSPSWRHGPRRHAYVEGATADWATGAAMVFSADVLAASGLGRRTSSCIRRRPTTLYVREMLD